VCRCIPIRTHVNHAATPVACTTSSCTLVNFRQRRAREVNEKERKDAARSIVEGMECTVIVFLSSLVSPFLVPASLRSNGGAADPPGATGRTAAAPPHPGWPAPSSAPNRSRGARHINSCSTCRRMKCSSMVRRDCRRAATPAGTRAPHCDQRHHANTREERRSTHQSCFCLPLSLCCILSCACVRVWCVWCGRAQSLRVRCSSAFCCRGRCTFHKILHASTQVYSAVKQSYERAVCAAIIDCRLVRVRVGCAHRVGAAWGGGGCGGTENHACL
jgi:hypothetical protein